jgi:hypothetical protein
MFTLASQHVFESDAGMCWLSALCGYNEDFSWDLHLQSLSALTHFPTESARASFGIHVHPPLGVSNWRELSGQGVEIPQEVLPCGFMFHCDMSSQWEDLVSLRLRFGETRRTHIEVLADGKGCVEAAPDIFPRGEVAFQIRTWAAFRGVAINVPLNASDPVGYSTAKIKTLLPQYAFSSRPILRRTSDDEGTVRAVEVLFSPDESVSGA